MLSLRRDRFVRWPHDDARRDSVGGKAFHLQALTHHGLPVPRWFVLTTAATEAILAPIRSKLEGAAPGGRHRASSGIDAEAARIRQLIVQEPWPRSVHRALRRAAEALGDVRRFAVRSSSVNEDGATESHAGQFETRLGVPPDALEPAVRACLAAAFEDRAGGRSRAGAVTEPWPRLAILVQEFVTPRVAGVAFTADPRSGEPRDIVVAGYGLGAGVVGDMVETDTFERRLGDTDWSATIRRKTCRVVPDGQGGSLVTAVAPDDQAAPTLSGEQLESLAGQLRRIEHLLGDAQDVEWALDAEGRIHILQARPITTLPGRQVIWDDSNIGESYPGITLPLTYSLVRRTYEHLFTNALAEIGIPRAVLRSLAPDLRHLIGIVRGHLYMNLRAYYRLFAAAPGIEWTIGMWREALGIRDDAGAHDATRGVAYSRFERGLLGLRVWARFLRRFIGVDGEVDRFCRGVEEMLREHDGGWDGWSFDAVLDRYRMLERDYLDEWTVLIFNDLFAFIFNAWLVRLCADPHADQPSTLHQRLLTDLDRAGSVRPLERLRRLAEHADRVPSVRALLRSSTSARDAWIELERLPEAWAFRDAVGEHVARYGDRTVEELKLETVTPAEAPWQILDLLRSLGDGGRDAASVPDQDGRGFREARLEFLARWRWRPLHRWGAAWVLRRARRLIAARERMSFARARAYGLLRRLTRSMDRALVREGVFGTSGAVLYATLEDLEAHAAGGLAGASLDALVQARRQAYLGFGDTQPAHRVVCRGSVYRASARTETLAADATGAMAGIPCSPGRAEGTACVITNGTPPEAVRGKILVARVTEPGWIFLMSLARGVVVERGSLLSHAAIIGRELGIPTIVGATGATTRIRSGDHVEMDGGTGVIHVRPPATRPSVTAVNSR